METTQSTDRVLSVPVLESVRVLVYLCLCSCLSLFLSWCLSLSWFISVLVSISVLTGHFHCDAYEFELSVESVEELWSNDRFRPAAVKNTTTPHKAAFACLH